MTEHIDHVKALNMSAITIRVRHQNNFMVSKLIDIEGISDTATKSSYQIFDLYALKSLFDIRLLSIQNLTEYRKNCLMDPVSPLLGRPTS